MPRTFQTTSTRTTSPETSWTLHRIVSPPPTHRAVNSHAPLATLMSLDQSTEHT